MSPRKHPCRRRLGRGIEELTRAAAERSAGCEAQLRHVGAWDVVQIVQVLELPGVNPTPGCQPDS